MAQAQAPSSPNQDTGPNIAEGKPSATLRRSHRARRPPAEFGTDDLARHNATSTSKASPQPAASSRRNPKRKAAPEVFDVPNNLLEASLGPWQENEQDEWPSWTEIESEPAFFNGILDQLGVKDAKIEEVLSVDEDSLAQLPDPTYGLVFLYEYVEEGSSEAAESGQTVWFANQTTNNACATVALFNIIMNAEGLALGEKLDQFKQESMELAPPLRGNLLSNSHWIRVAHNSFTRRLDLLNAALSLQNEVDDKNKKRAKTSSRRKKTKPTTDTAYHFIAFVPAGGDVWQLDGLEWNPHHIGKVGQGQHWTAIVQPVIKARMMQYETDQLSFSLLALCRDQLASIRRDLAINICCLQELDDIWASKLEWNDSKSGGFSLTSSSSSDKLQEYRLDAEDVLAISHQADEFKEFKRIVGDPSVDATRALEMRQKLYNDQMGIRSDYVARMRSNDEETAKIPRRKLDHTPAIHEWVQKLADHGVLEKLHQDAQLQNPI
ncbi:ubiquitin thiolesterase-like protein [Lasiosphaeria ovina]|uniref:Ubiquitin carboxyl-terminal hydrolase n=1 Tax=Lasiosphaeria ovina TaxID=92902 RepID=A0AAE0KHD3_9PEZI|nr:ubiquitin thiolesterase-like protein [Lasiosphaeria ovina]